MRSVSARLAQAAVIVAVLTPGSAAAHDSLAPPGAPHRWLPHELWVWRHRVPFDERRLEAALELKAGQLEAYLFNDHRTLATLARYRGVSVPGLADALVDDAPPQTRSLRRQRVMRVLTQGHLAQHLLFHVFHGDYIVRSTPTLFAASRDRYWKLRRAGRTPLEIAAANGARRDAIGPGLARLFVADRTEAIDGGETPSTEAARILRRQLQRLPCWLRRPEPSQDPGSTYGRATALHGVHRAGWPATRADWSASERRTERVRRALKPSCWPRPGPWRWRGDGPALISARPRTSDLRGGRTQLTPQPVAARPDAFLCRL